MSSSTSPQATMPIILPKGFASPVKETGVDIRSFFGRNAKKPVLEPSELEERVTELELQVDQYQFKANGHWNAIVKAESKIASLESQINILTKLVMRLESSC